MTEDSEKLPPLTPEAQKIIDDQPTVKYKKEKIIYKKIPIYQLALALIAAIAFIYEGSHYIVEYIKQAH